MSKKSETPASVRVARWAAIAAAITALGTIGNTFIEKRPWFLGGDEEPAVVEHATVRSQPTHFEAAAAPPITFHVAPPPAAANESPPNAGLNRARMATRATPGISRAANVDSAAEVSSAITTDANVVEEVGHYDARAGEGASYTAMSVQSAAPDFTWYEKSWAYIRRHQTEAWIVLGSAIFGTFWLVTEFFYGRKKKKDRETQAPFST